MNLSMAYLGQSRLFAEQGRLVLTLQPNLEREPVAFDAPLLKPVRFREAVSALHDVVISDLRFVRRDKTAYREWKQAQDRRPGRMIQAEYERLKQELPEGEVIVPRPLEKEYNRLLKQYRKARRVYDKYLRETDFELWRMISPYDPVITVADDVVFLECFSRDESAYGCLTVDCEGGFGTAGSVRLGTTNVDYSWELYNQFQRLRTYRETRFRVDPEGFEVKTDGRADYREEKIELPGGWLRGFMQIQAAMGMPMRKVPLSVDAVYSLLAWLKRHREKSGPRAVRFNLLPGEAPEMVLEPWELPIKSVSTRYDGPGGEPVRIWGRRRLMVLARLLPLVERVDVYLLGTGLPSFWVAKMGEMHLTLGLSGWTANEWTRGSALDLLAPPVLPSERMVSDAAAFLRTQRAGTLDQIEAGLHYGRAMTAAVLNRLAHCGQAIYDLAHGRYRWRQALPMALGEEQTGPENPELAAANRIVLGNKATIDRKEDLPTGTFLQGRAENTSCELVINCDGLIGRGKCGCAHHRKFGIRRGPCRHLLAIRQIAWQGPGEQTDSCAAWYARMVKWANN
ncbi:MAG: metal-binding protein [Thermodesulfobacteriota bacterium]